MVTHGRSAVQAESYTKASEGRPRRVALARTARTDKGINLTWSDLGHRTRPVRATLFCQEFLHLRFHCRAFEEIRIPCGPEAYGIAEDKVMEIVFAKNTVFDPFVGFD